MRVCSTRNPSPRRAALLGVLVVLMAIVVTAADEPVVTSEPTPATAATAASAEQAPPVAVAGLVAYIDPTTGAVTSTPTAEQRAAMQATLAAALDRSEEGLYDVELPDGTIMRDLQGRFQHATIVRIAPDGSLHQSCTTSPDAVTAPVPAGDDQTTTPVVVAE